MDESFAATTDRRLVFWESPSHESVRSMDPRTPVTVTIDADGVHTMTASAAGKTFTRVGRSYTAVKDSPVPSQTIAAVGGIDLGTEYGDTVADLAFALAEIPYPGIQSWADVDPQTVDNYFADAHEIVRSYPHLLSFGERERLAPALPDVAV